MAQWRPQVGTVQHDQPGMLRTVQQLLRSGKLEEAQAILIRVVTENPDFAGGHLLLGNTYYRQRRYDEALAEYQQALERNPGLAPAPLMMGMVFRAMNEPKNALQHFDMALEIDPDLIPAHVQKGRLQLDSGQIDEAAASAAKAIAANPQAVFARLLQAEIHARGDESSKALEILQDLVKDRPELVIAHQMLGVLYLRLDRAGEAKAALQTAAQLRPERPLLHFMLGGAHFKMNELNAAEKCYRDALNVSQKFLPAMYGLADVLTAGERHTEAIGILNNILQRSRRANSVHQRLGAIYTIQGRYNRAIEEFRAALGRDPKIMAMDPTIGAVLDSAPDAESAAKSFMERLKAIRVQASEESSAKNARRWTRGRTARGSALPRPAS